MKKIIFILFLSALFLSANAQTTGSVGYWDLQGNSTTDNRNFIGTTDRNPLIFKTGNLERMRLLPNKSFLGIGLPAISIPEATLHLHFQVDVGNPIDQKLLQLTTPTCTTGLSISYNKDTKDLYFRQQEAAKFFLEGPGGGLAIAPTGKIGIGIDAPKEKLHISNGNLLISGQSTGIYDTPACALIFSDVIDNSYPLGRWGIEYCSSSAFDGLMFRKYGGTEGSNEVGDQQIFSLSNSGNAYLEGKLGIGTTNPTAKLEVAGTFKATSATIPRLTGTTIADELKVDGLLCAKEVRVRLAGAPCWPDYVFSKNYKLMPLKELEQFVNENQHLPNIPSAAEVEENGIELGAMNTLLLKKIEELTLYIFQIEKRLSDLESK